MLLLLAGADAFGIKLLSLRQGCRTYFTQHAQNYHDPPAVDAGINTRRRKHVCTMAIDPELKSDSRIRGDPEALERWFCSMGGTLGPVVMEGELGVQMFRTDCELLLYS